jgi:hypothetical protein
MRRRILQTARAASFLTIVIVVSTFLLSAIWTGGVYGRDGDLLLGVFPGQLRIGWSQDWNNDGDWAHFHMARSSEALQLGFLGGNTFTSAAPFEIALDFPIWLFLVPLAASFVYCQRLIRRLPSGPACRRCGYPVGSSSRCTECGAPLVRPVTQPIASAAGPSCGGA